MGSDKIKPVIPIQKALFVLIIVYLIRLMYRQYEITDCYKLEGLGQIHQKYLYLRSRNVASITFALKQSDFFQILC